MGRALPSGSGIFRPTHTHPSRGKQGPGREPQAQLMGEAVFPGACAHAPATACSHRPGLCISLPRLIPPPCSTHTCTQPTLAHATYAHAHPKHAT